MFRRLTGVLHRPWALLLVLGTLVPAGLLAGKLQTNNTVETFLVQGDPDLAFYRETIERFGGDRLVYLSVDFGGDGVFSVGSLRRLDEVTRAVAGVEGVARVTSLASTDAILDRDGWVESGPLMVEPPSTVGEVERIEEKVFASSLLPWFVSPDRGSALVVIEVDPELGPVELNRTVVAIHGALERPPGGDPSGYALAGNPVFAEAIDRLNARDQKLFSGLMLALVLISSALWLRRLTLALLVVAVVLVTVTWTTGLLVASGHQSNWVVAIVSPLLFLIGVASAIHVLSYYRDVLPGATSRREAVAETLQRVAVPCLFTSLTTAVGFAALMANQIGPIQVFGGFASIGVLLAFVATLLVVPAGLSLRRKRDGKKARRGTREGRALHRLTFLDRLAQEHPGIVLAASAVVALAVIAGVHGLRVETNNLEYFRQDTPVVRHSLSIEETYGGSAPLDVVVDTGRPDGVIEPELLTALVAFQDRLEAIPGVARGISLADLTRDLHHAMAGADRTTDLPDDLAMVDQLLLLPDAGMVGRIVDTERRTTRVATRFAGATLGLKQSRELLAQVQHAADETLGEGARLTGSSLLFIRMDRYLVTGQVRSLAIVLVLLLVIMTGLYRSLRMGLLAMIPNVLPIAMMLGLMGWLDVPLDGLTAMIACIAIGIGVDDTIHYLHHLRHELGGAPDLSTAMSRTLAVVGRPIVFTSVVLTAGFGVFCFSDFLGTRNFGLLTGLTVMVALAADLLVLPAVLSLVGVPRSWRRS